MKPTKFKAIHGWFNEPDQAVYDQAVERAKDGDIFVEIGVWFGRSACYMAELIKASGKQIQFFAVDVWKVYDYEKALVSYLATIGNPDTYQVFLENMEKAEVADFVIPLHLDSLRASRLFREGSIEFVYVDASHGYDQVCKDIDAWLPKVRKLGVLAGHDYDREGVRQAVKERFKNFAVTGISWSAVKW
jgi:predicted O-methyltransferase YrrM